MGYMILCNRASGLAYNISHSSFVLMSEWKVHEVVSNVKLIETIILFQGFWKSCICGVYRKPQRLNPSIYC